MKAFREVPGAGPAAIAIAVIIIVGIVYLLFGSTLKLATPEQIAGAVVKDPFATGVVLLIVIALLGALLGRSKYLAGVRFVAPGIPAVAATATFIAYVLPAPLNRDPQTSVLIGIAAAFGLISIGGVLAIPAASGGRRQERTYIELCQRTAILRSQIEMVKLDLNQKSADDQEVIKAAWAEVNEIAQTLSRSLVARDQGSKDDCPETAIDYISLWRLVHRAEEALLMVVPTNEVIAQAIVDKERLAGSNIPNAKRLLELQKLAMVHIDAKTSADFFGS